MTYDEKVLCYLLKSEECCKKFLLHRCDRFLKEKNNRMFSRTVVNFFYDYNKIPNSNEYAKYVEDLKNKDEFCLTFVKYSNKSISENFDFIIDMLKNEFAKEKIAEVISNIDFDKLNLEQVKEDIHKISMAIDIEAEEKEGFIGDADVDEMVHKGNYMKTGYSNFDEHVYGISKKETYLFFGRAGIGKTRMLLNVAYKLAEQGYYGMFITLEMPKSQMDRLYFSRFAQVKSNDIKFGKVEKQELESIKRRIQEARHPLQFIEYTKKADIAYIKSKIRAFKKKHPLEFVVIDYMNLMREGKSDNRDRTHEYGYIAQELKNIAKQEDVAIITAVQSNRVVLKAETPGLEHIALSDQIQYAFDFIAYMQQGKLVGQIMNVKILKFREGPVNIDVKFLVDFATSTIEDTKE